LKLKNYVNRNVNQVSEELKAQGYTPVILGDGSTIIQQYPERDTTILNNEKILFNTNSNKKILQNMKGWSHKEVSALANFMDIDITIKGSGFVEKQSIKAGTELKKDQKVEVNLK